MTAINVMILTKVVAMMKTQPKNHPLTKMMTERGRKINPKGKSALTRWVLYRRGRLPLSFKRDQTGLEVGPTFSLQLSEALEYMTWHHKGDYIASISPNAGTKAVAIHQLSKALTQHSFTKSSGYVQAISFHPSRPFIFITTQQHIKVFDLVAQKMVKKLLSGCKWLSSADVHPSGDHIIVGSYYRRLVWFDLDISSTLHKTLKFHEKAVRAVAFHKRYPLMASASDDGSLHVFHLTVYTDLSLNPLIVPLKILRGHGVCGVGKGGGVVLLSIPDNRGFCPPVLIVSSLCIKTFKLALKFCIEYYILYYIFIQ